MRWQCRRGMRELDELLVRYLETRYERANESEKEAFRSILALPDAELNSYLLQRQTPSSEPVQLVIKHLLSPPQR